MYGGIITGQLKEMSRKGDVNISWNSGNPQEVAAAREAFNNRVKEGWAAFAEKRLGQRGEKIKVFDPDVERIVLVPPITGG